MPSPAAWQAAIGEAGFPVQLDTDFDVESFTGFLPCPVLGQVSDFEYYSSPVSGEDVQVLGLPPGTDFSVQLCIGSHSLELVSALAAAGTLAALSGGTLVDPHRPGKQFQRIWQLNGRAVMEQTGA